MIGESEETAGLSKDHYARKHKVLNLLPRDNSLHIRYMLMG